MIRAIALGGRNWVEGSREMAESTEDASVSEPEKVCRGPTGNGTDSSGQSVSACRTEEWIQTGWELGRISK